MQRLVLNLIVFLSSLLIDVEMDVVCLSVLCVIIYQTVQIKKTKIVVCISKISEISVIEN